MARTVELTHLDEHKVVDHKRELHSPHPAALLPTDAPSCTTHTPQRLPRQLLLLLLLLLLVVLLVLLLWLLLLARLGVGLRGSRGRVMGGEGRSCCRMIRRNDVLGNRSTGTTCTESGGGQEEEKWVGR